MARRRRRGGGGGHGEGGDERWLLTYADMITLLLALFIVLFAMSTLDVVRFDALKRTLSESFRGQVLTEQGKITDGSTSFMDGSHATTAQAVFEQVQQRRQANRQTSTQFHRETATLKRVVAQAKVPGAKVVTTERGIVVRLAGDTYFASGSARLNPGLEGKLERIARALAAAPHPLSIEGHTDGQPIRSAEFPGNLRLSTRRAETVFDFLAAHGLNPKQMRVAGYADAKPLQQPQYPQQAIARNRRVEIVVLAPGADVREAAAEAGGAPKSGVSKPGDVRRDSGAAPLMPPIDTQIIGPIIDLSKG